MSKGKNQYVVPTKEGWGVRSQGSEKSRKRKAYR